MPADAGPQAMMDARVPVLLYDGTCALCNGIVGILLRVDTRARIAYTPLQSAPGQEFLHAAGMPTDAFDSLVFVPDWSQRADGKRLLRTDGLLAVFAEMGGAWRAVAWLRILPAFLRDFMYRLVARTRFAIFGKYRYKPLSNPEWQRRFLAR